MKVKPLNDWAVIRPSDSAERTAGGLYIPDTAKDKPQEGIVEAIGPGALEEEKRRQKKGEKKERRFVPTVVKVGDHVMYARYAGQTYTVDGEELVLVRERDILGILPAPLETPARVSSTTVKSPATARAGRQKTVKKPAAKKAAVKKTKKAAKKTVKKQAKKTGKTASKPTKKIKTKKAVTRKAGKRK